MASIEYRARTTRVIAYLNKDKQTFALGPVTVKDAERFANNIDALLHERRCGLSVSREVSNWLSTLDDTLYSLLAERGLVEPRVQAVTLDAFATSYIDNRDDVTEGRRKKLRNSKAKVVEFFGDVNLDTVTAGAADDYGRWLIKQYASATAQKECQTASQFFRHAYRKGVIDKNPFDGVAVGRATNDDRRVFVSLEVAQRVLDKCPDWQWRLVFALARFGGLRCPSEIAPLKWSDIHWDVERFTVTSPKTKRYGKGSRVVPLFPELRPFLDEAYFRDDADKTWVVPMLAGNADKNLGTRFRKIVRKAGVDVWPKPFQNCRASRQTDLEQLFPTYVVCAWLGNTPTIARKHYLTVTDDHFAAAVGTGDQLGTQTPAETRTDAQQEPRIIHKARKNASFSEVVALLEEARVAEEGLEVAIDFRGETYILAFAGDSLGTIRPGQSQGTNRLALAPGKPKGHQTSHRGVRAR
jgi:integrase